MQQESLDGTNQHINVGEQERSEESDQRQRYGESLSMPGQGVMHNIRDITLQFDSGSPRCDNGSGIIGNVGGIVMFRPRECDFEPSNSLHRYVYAPC